MTDNSPQPVRILMADDHVIVLEMFEQFISNLPDVTVQTAPDLHAALAIIDSDGPFDLVLLDLDMPGMNGLEGLGIAIERNKKHPVALLTSSPPPHVVSGVLQSGASGIVLKTTSLKNFSNEIKFMAAGGRYIPVQLIENKRITTLQPQSVNLSEREMSVLGELAEGKTNRDIGDALGLAEATVKMHVKSICFKLEVTNRTQAVIVARDLNLF